MEFKDIAAALAGIAVVSLTLGFLTGGMPYYAMSFLAMAAIAADLWRCLRIVRSLKRDLAVSRTVSGVKLLLGSKATVVYDLEYRGRRNITLRCVQPAEGPAEVDGSPLTVRLVPGRQSVAFAVRPACRGSHVVKGLRIAAETLLFRVTATSGSDVTINTYLTMGHDRTGTLARRGGLKRLRLPGSEKLCQGTGSDFSGIRDFTPGDSTRDIDWARSSRSPALVVREYEDERVLPLFILIDTDSSMDRGTTETELESGVGLATVLAGQVLVDNERAGLACFSGSDVTCFLPLAGGKGQMARIRDALSSLKAAGGCPSVRSGFTAPQDAEAVRRLFRGTAGEAAIVPILDDSIRQFSANVREDGFVKAVAQASLSTGMPCSIVVITNLSMGMASLLSGLRIATYYGHHVCVALAPQVWYDDGENADPEKCYDRYRQAKDVISCLRGHKIDVMELSPRERPEALLYHGRTRCSPGRRDDRHG